ncbi:head-tail connector protein, partial [Klebsiella pneumoniae]
MPATLLTPPLSEPVALADVKAELRLETGDEDALVERMLIAARAHIETVTRRVLVTQTWRVFIDVWPPLTRYAEPP